MDIQPAEISAILKREIQNFGADAQVTSMTNLSTSDKTSPTQSKSVQLWTCWNRWKADSRVAACKQFIRLFVMIPPVPGIFSRGAIGICIGNRDAARQQLPPLQIATLIHERLGHDHPVVISSSIDALLHFGL